MGGQHGGLGVGGTSGAGYYSDDFLSSSESATSQNFDYLTGRPTLPKGSNQQQQQQQNVDNLDFTVIRFNRDYVIRGRFGKYLTTVLDEQSNIPQTNQQSTSQNQNTENISKSNLNSNLGGASVAAGSGTGGVSGSGTGGAAGVAGQTSKAVFSNTNVNASKTYLLGVNGQGIGEDIDCLNFVCVDNNNK
jgi:hypothetical protein